jgi:hypothetical protein
MTETHNLLPELKLEHSDIFKPELDQILFYFNKSAFGQNWFILNHLV